jgi:hypothetical protein
MGIWLALLHRRRLFPLATLAVITATLMACDDAHDGIARTQTAPNWDALATQILDAVPALDPSDQGPIFVMLREHGQARASLWHEGGSWNSDLAGALAQTFAESASRYRDHIDAIELCLTYDYRPVTGPNDRALTNVHRGIRGIELSAGRRTERYSPTEMLATNRDFQRVIERFGGTPEIRVFEAHQLLLLRDGPHWHVRPMMRGNEVVPIEAVTREAVERLAKTMGHWMQNQVRANGRITYKYWPSSGEESSANNMIRQFMATVCLGRLAEFYEDPEFRALQDKNLAYNMKKFYGERTGLGYIEFDRKAKLGAAALAALALVEHPGPHPYEQQQAGLIALTRHLWQSDGSFRTFYFPPERNDNQNFYPGEALLLWAALLEHADHAALREPFMKSFAFYRAWHLANRNPAFIPWHTQAYYLVWQQARDPELAAFVFEMNDWLLDVQEWDQAVYPDTKGRFYDPRRPFGPPHASSTGVYLEGLIDAFALARERGDTTRAEHYRRAILRGLRSLMQLQFADDVDMFYVAKRGPVQGGLRTTVYNNEIRIDNVQHGLMAILKILQTFASDDYAPH